MKKDNKDVIYCVFCGEKNDSKDKKCKKCNKKLNPRNHLYKDYVLSHVKDDLKENAEDSILGFIEAWIISHLYGIATVLAIAITAFLIITKNNEINAIKKKQANIKELNTPFVVVEKCEKKELLDQERYCDDGFNLQGDTCIKYNYSNAKVRTGCPNGYTLSDNICLSNNNVTLNKITTCATLERTPANRYTEDMVVSKTPIDDNTCKVTVCITREAIGGLWVKGTPCNSTDDSVTVSATTTYSCPAYTDANGNCKNKTNPTKTNYCDVGVLKGNRCETSETREYKLRCPAGSFFNEKCGKCEKEKEA